MINKCMNSLTTITNQISNEHCNPRRKTNRKKNVLYPAESTKHKHEISSTIASIDTDQTQDAI